ncbi:MAG: glycosyltransferase family 39 protein, partial [Planctomycetaceae bacterium]|nr:glycosyltransferase family 39 protein [Planctomycetaceae bacterium]
MSTDTANNSLAPPLRHRCELPSGANRRWLVLILLLGLILRVATAWTLQYQLDQRWQREFLILGDANGYWELGEKLAAGDEYRIYEPPRYALRMPGFPTLLAISINVFGNSKSAARIFMAVLCSLAPILCYFLGSKLRDERTGLIAALLTAISPVFIAFSPVLLCESVFSVALLGTLLPGCCLLCDLQSLPLKRGIVLSLIT